MTITPKIWYTHRKFMLKSAFAGIANRPLEDACVELTSTDHNGKY